MQELLELYIVSLGTQKPSKALTTAGWQTLDATYKRKLLLLVHRAEHVQNAPVSIKGMFTRRKTPTHSEAHWHYKY